MAVRPTPSSARILMVPVRALKLKRPALRLPPAPMVMVLAYSSFVPLPSRMVWMALLVGLSEVMVAAMMVLSAARIRIEPFSIEPPPLELVGSPMRSVPLPRLA